MIGVLSKTVEIVVNNKIYTINKNPSWETLYQVSKYRHTLIEKNKYNNWLSSREAFLFLVKNKIIPENFEIHLEEILVEIDNQKKFLYQNRNNEKICVSIRKKITGLKKMYGELYAKAHSLDYITFDFFIDYVSDIYLLSKTVSPKASYQILQSIYDRLQETTMTINQIRKIARTEPWKSYWYVKKLAAIPYDNLNEEQISLLSYSRMYENIYDNPECPDDSVIQDDDMLDGWMILLKEKREREKTVSEMERKNPKLKNATEVFLPASNKDQVAKISALNSDVAKSKKLAREQMIKSVGTLNDKDFVKKGLDVK